MKKTTSSSKYLKVFDPFQQSSQPDSDTSRSDNEVLSSCYLKNVETVKHNQNNNILQIQQINPKISASSRISKESNNHEKENDQYKLRVSKLQKQISSMKHRLQEKDNKLILLTQHLETLEFNQQIFQKQIQSKRNQNKSLEQKQSSFDRIYKILQKFQKTNRKSKNSKLTAFVKKLKDKATVQSPQLIIEQLLGMCKTIQADSERVVKDQISKFKKGGQKYEEIIQLNKKLFEENKVMKQQNIKLQIQCYMQINSLVTSNYHTSSLLKTILQTNNNHKINETISQYMKTLQKIIESNKTLQVLNKNIRQFKQVSIKKRLDQQNQPLYLKQVSFKTDLIEKQKQQIKSLNSTLNQLYDQIQTKLLLQQTRRQEEQFQEQKVQLQASQRLRSPLSTFQNSVNIFSKRGCQNMCGTTVRNRLFEEITKSKTERELIEQKSMKQLKMKICSRSKKSSRDC